MWGNTFISFLLSHQPDTLFDEVRSLNANSKKVPLLGFNPNVDEVKTLLASISAVEDQYDTQVAGGYIDPAVGIPQYVEALKKAGIDELIARLQAQIDTWAASNK
jgi:putative aldouronate transport system substrate-binding protein